MAKMYIMFDENEIYHKIDKFAEESLLFLSSISTDKPIFLNFYYWVRETKLNGKFTIQKNWMMETNGKCSEFYRLFLVKGIINFIETNKGGAK